MSTMIEPTSAVRSVRPEKVYGSSLLRVAEIFEYVSSSEKVTALAEIFQSRPDLMAVGVCDDVGTALGLITRVSLFSQLGKPFGREVHGRKPVADLTEAVETFNMNANLFQAAEGLQASMDKSTLHYYLLTDNDGGFRGIFSSKDLLAYLSKITQEDIHLAAQLQEAWLLIVLVLPILILSNTIYFLKDF